jgi:hypothetical protein
MRQEPSVRPALLASSGIVAAAIFAAIVSLQSQTQSQAPIGANTPALVITAYNGGPATTYSVPRTPWGDPDLQGTWSSDDTANIPASRPANFGDRLFMTDEEFKARQAAVAKGVQAGENAEGSFRGDFARRSFPRRARPRSARHRAIRARSATVRSSGRPTSRCTTGASRVASGAR